MIGLAIAWTVLLLAGGFLLFAPAMVSAVFQRPTSLPRPMPTIRFNEHPFVRRIYGKVLGTGATLKLAFRSIVSAINRSLSRGGYALRSGMLNYYVEPMPVIPFGTAPVKENLPRGVYLADLQCRLTGQLDIAGANNDCTLQTEPIARLIRSLRVWYDGIDLIHPIAGRDLAALSRRLVRQPLTGAPIADADTQAATLFELNFVIPFSRAYNADPFETALPPFIVKRGFHVEVQWETGLANAVVGTNAGSLAIATGGTDSVAISNVQLQINPRIARNGSRPWYLPQISVYETENFAAANARLTLDMDAVDPFDAVLFRCLDGGQQDPADDIQSVTFRAKSTRIIDDVDFQTLRAIEEGRFPGVQDANELGSLFVQLNDGGKLGNIVDPAELTLPEFEFNVEAPAVGPGLVRAVVMELLTVPNVTRG